jgi:nitrous oxide reductase accessory protein NosL
MNRILLGLVMLLLLTVSVYATDKVEAPKACLQCGMNRITFAYSRMVIDYADGTSDGVCSLNCAVEQMKKYPKKQVMSLKVADYATKELVDARTATWVVGGNKLGVMTAMPKWAFARKEDAEKFIKENDGRLTNFNEALDLALKENE